MIYDYVVTKPPLNEETLAHYGVKGMKWRRRKKKSGNKGKLSILNLLTNTGLNGDPRFKKMGRPKILTRTKRLGNPRPHPQVTSAMKYDPRYENKTSSLNAKTDSRYRTQRAKPSVTSAMKYDPRYERKTSGINYQTDSRFQPQKKRKTKKSSNTSSS